jgi:hypothetical protein
MPTYQLACRNSECEKEWEAYVPLFSSPNPKCSCGAESDRIWRSSIRKGADTFPYVTTHLTGKPIEITSASHLRSLEKQHGVVNRPDAAWTEKRVVVENGRKRYVEGSGMGLKGVWI